MPAKLLTLGLALLSLSLSLANAFEQGTIAPPLITSVRKDLGNNEIWHIGGAVSVPGAEVILYLQSENGNALSFNLKADSNGEWFYKHDSFLKEGSYKSWAQLKVGKEFSLPSPEVSFKVVHTALSIGAFRISYSTIYLASAAILLFALTILSIFGFYHYRKDRREKAGV